MSRLAQILFGFRVTIIYTNGAKVTMRFREFSYNIERGNRTAEWMTPVFAWSRKPLWINLDEITAIWQGKC